MSLNQINENSRILTSLGFIIGNMPLHKRSNQEKAYPMHHEKTTCCFQSDQINLRLPNTHTHTKLSLIHGKITVSSLVGRSAAYLATNLPTTLDTTLPTYSRTYQSNFLPARLIYYLPSSLSRRGSLIASHPPRQGGPPASPLSLPSSHHLPLARFLLIFTLLPTCLC